MEKKEFSGIREFQLYIMTRVEEILCKDEFVISDLINAWKIIKETHIVGNGGQNTIVNFDNDDWDVLVRHNIVDTIVASSGLLKDFVAFMNREIENPDFENKVAFLSLLDEVIESRSGDIDLVKYTDKKDAFVVVESVAKLEFVKRRLCVCLYQNFIGIT